MRPRKRSSNIFKGLKCIKPISRKEVEALFPRGLDLIYKEAHAIDKWPNYLFTTDDGRRFGLFMEGESILPRLEARFVGIDWKDTKGIERVKRIAGFIMEIGTDNPPLVFQEDFDLGVAWIEHHRQYNVELTEEECEILEDQLGVSMGEDDDSED